MCAAPPRGIFCPVPMGTGWSETMRNAAVDGEQGVPTVPPRPQMTVPRPPAEGNFCVKQLGPRLSVGEAGSAREG